MLWVRLWSSISRRYTTTGVTEPDHYIAKAGTACRQCGSNTEGHRWHGGGFVIAVLLHSQQCPTVHVDTSDPVNRWTVRRAARDPVQSRLPRFPRFRLPHFFTPPLLAPNPQSRPDLCLNPSCSVNLVPSIGCQSVRSGRFGTDFCLKLFSFCSTVLFQFSQSWSSVLVASSKRDLVMCTCF